MINVDSLNEDIKKFGIVIDKVDQLPNIYHEILNQVEFSKSNLEELASIKKEINEFKLNSLTELQKQHSEITVQLDKQQKECIEKLNIIDKDIETKLDKIEIELRDRVSLLEKNLLFELAEQKQIISKHIEEEKKRFNHLIVMFVGISVLLSILIVNF